jgi:molecular chaperone HtpG
MKRFQQMTKAMGQTNFAMPLKKTLVLNPRNPLIQNAFKIWEKGEKKELAEKMCHHVQDLAALSSEGLTSEEKEQFVNRSQALVQELSHYIV